MYFVAVICSAEVLKAAMQKSSSVSGSASPALPVRGNTVLVKRSGVGNTLTPIGPLGLSLQDDDSSSTPVRSRPQQPTAETGYSSDELQVLRSSHS